MYRIKNGTRLTPRPSFPPGGLYPRVTIPVRGSRHSNFSVMFLTSFQLRVGFVFGIVSFVFLPTKLAKSEKYLGLFSYLCAADRQSIACPAILKRRKTIGFCGFPCCIPPRGGPWEGSAFFGSFLSRRKKRTGNRRQQPTKKPATFTGSGLRIKNNLIHERYITCGLRGYRSPSNPVISQASCNVYSANVSTMSSPSIVTSSRPFRIVVMPITRSGRRLP